MSDPEGWRVCSICRTAIRFGERYYACSVSTCNRKRTALYFCSVDCWEAHLPTMRHRDAWAEVSQAPSREAHEQQLAEQSEAAQRRESGPRSEAACRGVVTGAVVPRDASSAARAAGSIGEDESAQDVLVVVSKLKRYVKQRSGMSTSDNVVGVLSDHLRELCRAAIRQAGADGRRTVMNRDFAAVLRSRDSH